GNVSASENVVKKAEAAGAEIIKGKVESINGDAKVVSANLPKKAQAQDKYILLYNAKFVVI
ncbi:MAG: hypothetical protein IIT86_08930, partial [Oscillospiraceae bacterium]|nr:hypothetical protein [Oscillospiraceae bacterium]